jgi:hypothetical protein
MAITPQAVLEEVLLLLDHKATIDQAAPEKKIYTRNDN